MVQIIATQSLPYGKKRYAAGDTVEVSEKDARLLVQIRRAVLPPETAKAPPSTLNMKSPEPANVEDESEAAPEAPAHPQTYSRRDMTAAPAGQTGPARSSQSSRPAHRPRGKT